MPLRRQYILVYDDVNVPFRDPVPEKHKGKETRMIRHAYESNYKTELAKTKKKNLLETDKNRKEIAGQKKAGSSKKCQPLLS